MISRVQDIGMCHGLLMPSIENNDALADVDSKITSIVTSKMHQYKILIKTWFLNEKKIQLFWKSRGVFFANVFISKKAKVIIQQEEIIGIEPVRKKKQY